MQKQNAFTLIELMIVVAIIGILAAIALPAYQDYTKRSYVAGGMALSSEAKYSVSEFFATNGAFPSNNAAAGLSGSIAGDGVKSILLSANGIITITYNVKVVDNSTMIITPSTSGGAIHWDCTGGSVDPKYRPSNCRP